MVTVISGLTMLYEGCDALRLGYWAILVSNQNRFEVKNLLTQLSNCSRKGVVFATEDLDFGLQVGKPLFLPLTTFQSCNPISLLISLSG